MPGRLRARTLAIAGIVAAVLASGCGPKRAARATPVAPQPPTLIVLLPDPETKVTGRARVSNEFGSTELTTARASSRASSDAPPGAATTISEAEVTPLFGEALAAMPPAPRHFTLQFKFESDALTDESTAQIPAILAAVKVLPVPEVVVVGHTDTMGDAKSNVALGLRRAGTVRAILVQAGLPDSTITVTSHGEADLLVRTRNNTPEPRNRRVEITVR